MFNKAFIITLSVFSAVSARNVNFNAIGPGNQMQVEVDGAVYDLSTSDPSDMYFSSRILNVNDGEVKYSYILDGQKENFVRTLSADNDYTYNDFFGRDKTLLKIEQFNKIERWDKGIGPTSLFDDSYILTIHFQGAQAEEVFKNPTKGGGQVEKITFFLRDEVYSYNNLRITTKNFDVSKFQISIDLGNNQIHGRSSFKLRNSGEDPTNLRQDIYSSMLAAAGAPVLRSNKARVFINKKPHGFYAFQEEPISHSYVRSVFHGKLATEAIEDPPQLGHVLDGTTGSDPDYNEANLDNFGAFEYLTQYQETNTKAILFGQALKALDPNDANAVQAFEQQWFDINAFHKAVAFEYLTADWDGYWFSTGNWVLYDDPTQSTENTFKFYFCSQDYDETFGVGLVSPEKEDGGNPDVSYKVLANRNMEDPKYSGPTVGDRYKNKHRILVDKFITGSPALQQRFENTLKTIVEKIFNPKEFNRRLDSMMERYDEDMRWDFSIQRLYQTNSPHNYKYEDYKQNIDQPFAGIMWGLKEFVKIRAETVANELGAKLP